MEKRHRWLHNAVGEAKKYVVFVCPTAQISRRTCCIPFLLQANVPVRCSVVERCHRFSKRAVAQANASWPISSSIYFAGCRIQSLCRPLDSGLRRTLRFTSLASRLRLICSSSAKCQPLSHLWILILTKGYSRRFKLAARTWSKELEKAMSNDHKVMRMIASTAILHPFQMRGMTPRESTSP